MKILLIHRYFWPDTPPYAIILKKIAARLAQDGHDVTVLSTQPTYKPDANILKQQKTEMIDGYTVLRMGLLPEQSGKSVIKALNMLFFGFRVVLHSLKNKQYDVVMVSTSPPVLAGLSARVLAKRCKAKLLYHCMDIHPEIGKLSGDFSNKRIFKLLQRIDSKTCQYAERVLVLSEDMKQAIIERENNKQVRIDVIQNFNLNDGSEQKITLAAKHKRKEGVFRLIFAGNIGRFQGLDILLEAFLELENSDNIELFFLGDGKMTHSLKQTVIESNTNNVHFIPHQPMPIANSIIESADLGIVSLSPNIYRYAYPTKVISYLSVGCPLLVMVEEESTLVSFIKEHQIGVNINQDDKLAFKTVISDLNDNRKKLKLMKENSIQTYNTFYNESHVLDKWSKLMSGI